MMFGEKCIPICRDERRPKFFSRYFKYSNWRRYFLYKKSLNPIKIEMKDAFAAADFVQLHAGEYHPKTAKNSDSGKYVKCVLQKAISRKD